MADFLPIIIITARDLATGITNFNVVKEDMQGEEVITGEHVLNSQEVRELLVRRGIVPETLGQEQDLKRLERRAKADERRIAKKSVLPAGDC
jgi:DNA-damage-inducible protein D